MKDEGGGGGQERACGVPRRKGNKVGSRNSGVIIITVYALVGMCVHMHIVHCMYKI